MIHIGKLYREEHGTQQRLCTRVSIEGRSTVLWFGVDKSLGRYFTRRADPFVLVMLGTALRRGLDIICEDGVSQRLLYQLQSYYIPALVNAGRAKSIRIHAQALSGAEENVGAVATGFTGGVDSLYTVMRHMPGKTQPDFALSHLTVLNVGAFKGENYRQEYERACEFAAGFAGEQGFELVCIDSNFNDVLQTVQAVDGRHSFEGEFPYRIIAAAMALSGLFRVYYHSSNVSFSQFKLAAREVSEDISLFDLLTVQACSTDGLSVYSSGAELSRIGKLQALADWEPARRWLHSCFTAEGNCGICRKCMMAQVVFHCLGRLEDFSPVFDTEKFALNRDSLVAQALAHSGRAYEDELEALVRAHLEISPAVDRKARMISAALASTDRYFKDKGTDVPYKWNK